MRTLLAMAFLGLMTSAAPSTKRGMTWGVRTDVVVPPRVVLVGCRGSPSSDADSGDCDPYKGDTACSTALPVLCIAPIRVARPKDLVIPKAGGVKGDPFYAGWSGSAARLTQPIAGSTFASRAEADAYCAKEIGSGWRMAEFHDGKVETTPAAQGRPAVTKPGGWSFYARGRLSDRTRFWVAIDDQPSNCWSK